HVLVKGWLDSLPLAPKTKCHVRNAFHLLFYFARWWKLTTQNPIDLVRQSSQRLEDPRVLTHTEFKALVGKLGEPYRTMVLVAGCLGLRASEIVGLKWGDVNWIDLSVFIRRSVVAGREEATKNRASKKPVPLDPELAAALLDWYGFFGSPI